MLNINAGHNARLMSRCNKLWEYSEFVACVKQKLREKQIMEQAVDEAVEECIRRGILKEILTTHRAEVKDMLLTEYNEELHIKNEKELAEAEGEARGEARGRKMGIQQGIEKEIFDSVFENDYSVERGAQKLNISKEEFEAKYQNWLKENGTKKAE